MEVSYCLCSDEPHGAIKMDVWLRKPALVRQVHGAVDVLDCKAEY